MTSDKYEFGEAKRMSEAERARTIKQVAAFLRFTQRIDDQLADLVERYSHLASPNAQRQHGMFRAERSR